MLFDGYTFPSRTDLEVHRGSNRKKTSLMTCARADISFYTGFICVMKSGHHLRTFRAVAKELAIHKQRYCEAANRVHVSQLQLVVSTCIPQSTRGAIQRRRTIMLVLDGGTLCR